jgi:hypothetical protein
MPAAWRSTNDCFYAGRPAGTLTEVELKGVANAMCPSRHGDLQPEDTQTRFGGV